MVKDSDFKLVGWREVPVNEDALGPMARDAQPKIFHLVIEA
jgi:glutamate synthase (NADPH/NADH) large chain